MKKGLKNDWMTMPVDRADGVARKFGAVLFDFNGTLSDDESLLLELFAEVFEIKLGYQLSSEFYYSDLAGLSDFEIVNHVLRVLGLENSKSLSEELLADKVRRYQDAVRLKPRISRAAIEFVSRVSARVPVGVVTGAIHAEVDPALQSAGLVEKLVGVVAGDDVKYGKPNPEGYLRALQLLPYGLAPSKVAVFEDSIVGLRAARSAGMFAIGVRGTADEDLLGKEAEVVVDAVASA